MDTLVVNVTGVLLIAWIVWYFLLSRRTVHGAATSRADVQEIHVLVKGGYAPDVIGARPGVPLRIHFRREETSPCSEEVVFPDFGIRRRLPAFETTIVEVPPGVAGRYGFACGMDMMHGTLVIGEPAALPPPQAPAAAAPEVDPICGMTVDPARAAATSVRDGRTVYFCCPGCKTRFDAGAGPETNGAAQRITLGVARRR